MSVLACVYMGMNDNHPIYHMGMVEQGACFLSDDKKITWYIFVSFL